MRSLIALIMLLPTTILAADATQTTPVTTVALGDIWIKPLHSAPATVVALNQSKLSAEINARIDLIHVMVGQQVTKDQPLVALDCRDHRSHLAQQQSELVRLQSQASQAGNKLKRALNLKNDRNISQEQLEERDTELAALTAQIKAQKETVSQHLRDVERCNLTAPFAGEVKARLASEGELAAPGTPLIELLQHSGREVEANIRPGRAEQLITAKAHFRFQGTDYPVRLARITTSLDPTTRTRTARFTFDAKAAPAGSAGRLLWRDPRPHVPADFIQQRDDQLGYFVSKDKTASFISLSDALEGRPAAVTQAADARLVDQGRHGLKQGDSLKIVK